MSTTIATADHVTRMRALLDGGADNTLEVLLDVFAAQAAINDSRTPEQWQAYAVQIALGVDDLLEAGDPIPADTRRLLHYLAVDADFAARLDRIAGL